MANIYELSEKYNALLEKLSDPENADHEEAYWEAAFDTEDELKEKADNYAKVIRNMSAEAEALKSEADRLDERRKAIENGVKRLRSNLENAMRLTETPKFKTTLFSFNIQKNPPAVDDYDPGKIPEKYYIPQPPKLDKITLLADLKNGVDVPGAAIKQSEGLRIR